MELDLRQLLRIARRHGWIVLLAMLICGSVAYTQATQQVNQYQTSARVLMLGAEDTGSNYTSMLASEKLADTYQQLIENDENLNAVIKTLSLPFTNAELNKKITSSVVPNTLLLQISVVDTDPKRAALIADTTAQQFVRYIQEHKGSTLSAPVEISNNARVPSAPFEPRPLRSGMLGAFIGLMIGAGAVALLEYFDSTVKPEKNLPGLIDAPILASIQHMGTIKPGGRQVYTLAQPNSMAAEATRLLRTNLEFATASGDIKKLVITSPVPGEGKSTIAANLGVVMAQSGLKTVIIDADLRKPTQDIIFGVPREEGLTTLLTRPNTPWLSMAKAVALPNLLLIPSGPLPPDPADMVSSQRFINLVDQIGQTADLIIIDSPPMLSASDTLAIAAHTDGLVFVCHSNKTRLDALLHANHSVRQGGIRVVGVVLNRLKRQRTPSYYGYGEYYGPAARDKPAHPTTQPIRQQQAS